MLHQFMQKVISVVSVPILLFRARPIPLQMAGSTRQIWRLLIPFSAAHFQGYLTGTVSSGLQQSARPYLWANEEK